MALDPLKPKSVGEAIVGNTILRPLVDMMTPQASPARAVKLGVGPAPVDVAVPLGRSSGMER